MKAFNDAVFTMFGIISTWIMMAFFDFKPYTSTKTNPEYSMSANINTIIKKHEAEQKEKSAKDNTTHLDRLPGSYILHKMYGFVTATTGLVMSAGGGINALLFKLLPHTLQVQHDMLYLMHESNVITHVQYVVCALCFCSIPTQVRFELSTWQTLVNNFVDASIAQYVASFCEQVKLHMISTPPQYFGTVAWCKANYMIKSHPGATSKPGCHAHDMFQAVAASNLDDYRFIQNNWFLFNGMYDDQVASVLLYFNGAKHVIGRDLALGVGIMGVVDAANAKQMSTMIKALGWNSTPHGAIICEVNTLAGRGVGIVNMDEELDRRTGVGGRSTAVDFDAVELRRAIDKCITAELTPSVLLPQDVWFQQRWGGIANGAHSNAAGRERTYAATDLFKAGARVHRKAFSEQLDYAQFKSWDGRVIATPSQKLENGKSRALYSCDSLTQFHFSWILSQAEADWANIDAIIDPGKCGVAGMGALLYKMKCNYPYMAMQDFDDFNSQHSLQAQALVIDVLCEKYRVDAVKRSLLVKSFDNMYIKQKRGDDVEAELHKVTGTLMSGHRGTTFINTVLNYAYMEIVHNRVGVKRTAKHVGDDIASGYVNLNDVEKVMLEAARCGLRLNRFKQSVGKYGMEFLRVAYDDNGNGFGYYARSVSSFVAGNWTNIRNLGPDEVLSNAVSAAYTLGNRCGNRSIAASLTYAVARRVQLPIAQVSNLLHGVVALGNGPVFSSVNCVNIMATHYKLDRVKLGKLPRDAPSKATDDYLAVISTPIDVLCYSAAPEAVRQSMLDSSYYKDMLSSLSNNVSYAPLVVHHHQTRVITSHVTVSELYRTQTQNNPLLESPLYMALIRTATEPTIKAIISKVYPGALSDWRTLAFGIQNGNNSFMGWLSYNDMMHMNGLVRGQRVIHNVGNYFV